MGTCLTHIYIIYTVEELGYDTMKGTFVSLYTSVFITDEYNIMVKSEELIGTTEQMTLYMRCRINQCLYNRVRLYTIRRIFVRRQL